MQHVTNSQLCFLVRGILGRGLPSLVVLYSFVSIKTCGVCQEEKESTTQPVGGFMRDLASVFLVKCACSKALGVQGGGFFGNVVWQRQNDSVKEEGDGKGKKSMCLCVLGTPSLCVMIPIFHTLVVNALWCGRGKYLCLVHSGANGASRCFTTVTRGAELPAHPVRRSERHFVVWSRGCGR